MAKKPTGELQESIIFARKYNFWKLFKHDNFVVKLDD